MKIVTSLFFKDIKSDSLLLFIFRSVFICQHLVVFDQITRTNQLKSPKPTVFGCSKTVSFEPCSLPTTVAVLYYLLKKLGCVFAKYTSLVGFYKINCSFIV